jgi:hypothetical protein
MFAAEGGRPALVKAEMLHIRRAMRSLCLSIVSSGRHCGK